MKKYKSKYLEGKQYYSWEYDEHTNFKHRLLACYLGAWFPILSSWFDLNYFDGFAGCGSYFIDDNEYPGSPVIAAKVWKDRGKTGKKLNIIAIDQDQEVCDNLRKVFNENMHSSTEYHIENSDFDNGIKKLLTSTSYESIRPSFFFIDPFGLNLDFSTLIEIMKHKKVELLLTFMYDGVSRCIGADSGRLDSFLGTKEWRELKDLHGIIREDSVMDLYRNQLQQHAQFVWPYKVHSSKADRTLYYLVHVSNHLKGATTMRDCFSSINHGRIEYLGKSNNQLSIFELKGFKVSEVQNYLLRNCTGFEGSYNDLLSLIIDATPYQNQVLRKAVKQFEKSGRAIVQRVTSKQTGIDKDDLVKLV